LLVDRAISLLDSIDILLLSLGAVMLGRKYKREQDEKKM